MGNTSIPSNDNTAGMKAALKSFAERMPAMDKVFCSIIYKVVDAVLPTIRLIPIIDKIETIGKLQFVIWKRIPEDVIKKMKEAISDSEIDDIVFEWQKEEIKETIEKLLENKSIANRPLLKECIDSYNQGKYNIASIGFTAIIDQLLSHYSKNATTNWKKRVDEIVKSVQRSGNDALNDETYIKLLLLTTYQLAQDSFGQYSNFIKGKCNTLNRHWIMHGRTTRVMSQKDCIKIINYTYGTLLMGEMILGVAEDGSV